MQYPSECKLSVPKIFKNEITIKINGGLTTFVGPNGSGKTQVLKALRDKFRNKLGTEKVRYISSNRIGDMEKYRSKTEDGYYNEEYFYLASSNLRKIKHEIETANGDFLIMDDKKEIFIKVAERLSVFFNRKIYIRWENGHLNAYFQKEKSDTEYSILHEASGLINLISILAAVYDDEIEMLLIDEPEVSLHPQLQAYLLNEIKMAIKLTKKTVILSTHSTEMIFIEKIEDLTNIIFFEEGKVPIQIDNSDAILNSNKLKTFITITMGHIHKKAFFAKKVFLVEGPSDEIICKFLLNKLNINMSAAGTELIVANGKDNFAQIIKFFKLIGKEVIILTDLDGLIDDNNIINLFNSSEKIGDELIKNGNQSKIVELVNPLKDDFIKVVDKNKSTLSSEYQKHPYYTCAETVDDNTIRRAMLAILMSTDDSNIKNWSDANEWIGLKKRFKAIFKYLRIGGCFILEKGSIESYYCFSPNDTYTDKINVSYEEAEKLSNMRQEDIITNYKEIIEALKFAADLKEVDESYAVQRELLSELSLAVLLLNKGIENEEEIYLEIKQKRNTDKTLFEYKLIENEGEKAIEVYLNSNIMEVEGFPLTIKATDNVNSIVEKKIRKKV